MFVAFYSTLFESSSLEASLAATSRANLKCRCKGSTRKTKVQNNKDDICASVASNFDLFCLTVIDFLEV